MVVELARLSPDLTVDEIGVAPISRPFPLLVCWAIWFTASAALWALALRAAAWLI